jgi:hypothetical protein
MTRCRKCPPDVLKQLNKAKESHDDERAKMKFGSQKAFFAKIWERLHDSRPYDPAAIRNVSHRKPPPNDGSMPVDVGIAPRNMPDGYFIGGQMPMMMGGPNGQMQMMMGGPQGQMPMMMGGGPQGGQMSMGGPQNMGMNPMGMGMGMMPNPEMMMRGYPDQFMSGGYNMMQFGGGAGGGSGSQTHNMPMKRGAEDDEMGSNKRSKVV